MSLGCGHPLMLMRSHTPIFPKLYGTHYQQASGLDELVGKFNIDLGQKVFCCTDEIAQNGGIANMSHLKRLADSSELRLEAKHLDPVKVNDTRNFVSLIIATHSPSWTEAHTSCLASCSSL
eukprot:5848508-Prymnesium_polylepis.1